MILLLIAMFRKLLILFGQWLGNSLFIEKREDLKYTVIFFHNIYLQLVGSWKRSLSSLDVLNVIDISFDDWNWMSISTYSSDEVSSILLLLRVSCRSLINFCNFLLHGSFPTDWFEFDFYSFHKKELVIVSHHDSSEVQAD